MKYLALSIILFMTGVFDLAVLIGAAYLIFGLNFSGWWWLLALLLLHAECVGLYKVLNAFLFDIPAKVG